MKKFIKRTLSTAVGIFLGSIFSLFILPIVFLTLIKVLQGGQAEIEEHSVLHLHLHGRLVEKSRPIDFNIFSSASPFSDEDRTNGLYDLLEAIRIARDDQRIDGIFLDIDGLSAGWSSLESLRRGLLDFKKSKKFIYAYADSIEESNYVLMTSADKLFLKPGGEMEFNGLDMSEAFVKGLLDKLDLHPRIFRVGKFKAAIEPLILDKMSAENREQNQALIDDLWSVIRQAITEHPNSPKPQQIDEMAANLDVLTAEQAKEKNLVTELAYRDEVYDLLSDITLQKDQNNKAEEPQQEKKEAPEAQQPAPENKVALAEVVEKKEEWRPVTPGQLLHEKHENKSSTGMGRRHSTSASSSHRPKVAVFFADGQIVSGSGDRTRIGSDAFVQSLEEVRKDEDVHAIVIRINSPGGSALASDVIWRELSVIDDQKPVVASMGDVAASGGYYIAAGARHIFAESSTITGSIGVFGVMFDTEKFFKQKLGVNFDRVVSHPYADIGNANRPMSDFERTKIQTNVETVYKRFIEIVRESRGLDEGLSSEVFAEGRVWSGRRAKDLKLVDEIGGLDQAIVKAAQLAELKEDSYDVDIYPKEDDPLYQLADMFMGQNSSLSIGSLFGFWEKAMPGILKTSSRRNRGLEIMALLPFEIDIH